MKIKFIRNMLGILLLFPAIIFGEKLSVTSRFANKDHIFQPIKIIVFGNDVYLFDKSDQSLKIFTKNGEFKKSIGQKGQGPGEFRNATDFWITEDKIYILDSHKIEVFLKKDGTYIHSKSIETTKSMKFCINAETFYISSLAYQKGEKLINKYFNKGELKLLNSFLDCTPIETGDMASIYKNFGFLAYLRGKVYFAYLLSNIVLEFSEEGKLLAQLKVPIPSVDIAKQEIKKTDNQILVKISGPAIVDIRAAGENLYLLSYDKGNSLIFKLENGVFLEKYRMNEKISSFDIADDGIWTIGSADNKNIDILAYKISRESNQKQIN